MYFQPANPGDNGAVFMTAAEISAKLVDYGSIKKPADIRKLGVILQRLGYCQRRLGHKGTRGYVVYLTQDIDNQRKMKAREAVDEDKKANSADNADNIF